MAVLALAIAGLGYLRRVDGTTAVTLVVTDAQGATATDGVQITVRDTTPPAVAIASPAEGTTVSGTINVVVLDGAGLLPPSPLALP